MLPEARAVKLFNPVNLKPKKNPITYKNKEEVFFTAGNAIREIRQGIFQKKATLTDGPFRQHSSSG
ncbi:hypothetical protein [Flavobacterium sp. H4147]|uniref:hypothetical protein n=1 Tax=Flavobacterium sp. H4147 TaxID=3034149 RepID=UPI0023EE204D|nr:hypothetical protein [Flavobacterium sp. H4147]